MKKLLFALTFIFIGLQTFSQIYLVTLGDNFVGGCSLNPYELTLTKVTPAGVQIHTCIPKHINDGALISLNQELNNITNQGYKLIETNNGSSDQNGLINGASLNEGTSWYFAIP